MPATRRKRYVWWLANPVKYYMTIFWVRLRLAAGNESAHSVPILALKSLLKLRRAVDFFFDEGGAGVIIPAITQRKFLPHSSPQITPPQFRWSVPEHISPS